MEVTKELLSLIRTEAIKSMTAIMTPNIIRYMQNCLCRELLRLQEEATYMVMSKDLHHDLCSALEDWNYVPDLTTGEQELYGMKVIMTWHANPKEIFVLPSEEALHSNRSPKKLSKVCLHVKQVKWEFLSWSIDGPGNVKVCISCKKEKTNDLLCDKCDADGLRICYGCEKIFRPICDEAYCGCCCNERKWR